MASPLPVNSIQPEVEALKKFAEAPPLQPVAPHQEVSSDQANKEALKQYAKEQPGEGAKTNILVPKEAASTGPLPTETEVKAVAKDKVTVEVEKLLEKNLGDIYTSLPDNIKPFFKSHGEKIAQTVVGMINNKSFDGGVVMEMVEDWLKLVPKSNSLFLEQEAKLKTDSIVKYVTAVLKE